MLNASLDTLESAEDDSTALLRSIERLESLPHDGPVELSLHGQVLTQLPGTIVEVLIRVLREWARGDAVAVLPVRAELTTQQAADLLNVSRQYTVRLMDQGVLPCHKVGKHRRIKATDLLVYMRDRDARQKTAVRQLTQEAQDLEIEY